MRPEEGEVIQSGGARRVWKDPDNEKPTGEWNTVDIVCFGQTSIHIVNGHVVMMLTGLRQKVGGRELPLTKGRLQIQSEAAEIFGRKLEVRPIAEIPRGLLE